MTAAVLRKLDKKDDRSTFSSGQLDLDRFFREFAGQNQFRHHLGTTYVATVGRSIEGYVTVVNGSLSGHEIPVALKRRAPEYPIPILRIARLAVSAGARGRGLGADLLAHALDIAFQTDDLASCLGVVVDAKPDAVGFYERCGFFRVRAEAGSSGARPEPVPMFLRLDDARAAR